MTAMKVEIKVAHCSSLNCNLFVQPHAFGKILYLQQNAVKSIKTKSTHNAGKEGANYIILPNSFGYFIFNNLLYFLQLPTLFHSEM